ncbi:MAG: TIGR04190 family B12-binding domain/radical SAM domain protein [Deltaproteobacteria bacterium]|nr:TIGR04190 family B12-binding domain/radical SAM domain protein [Candidatus Zymogenaceae bacterium]
MIQRFVPKADLVLIHPPSTFDYADRKAFLGPISDVVPSTPLFEMYPIGFSSIAEHLSKNGASVRIINLAYLILKRPNMDVRRFLRRLRARAFGISLHWLPHAHGAVTLARMLKEVQPDVPVIFGGYSSTYFHREIISYPFVDFILRGDSTERATLKLVEAIRNGGDFSQVSNLTWKKNGRIIVNDRMIVETHLNDFTNDYRTMFRKAVKYCSPVAMTPIHDWWRYPITMMVTCRGCKNNCAFCGGSNFAMKRFLDRRDVAFRDPERVARDVKDLSQFTTAPIFIVGDLRHASDAYARTIIDRLVEGRVQNHLVLELFNAAPKAYFEALGSLAHVNFEISPETHDDALRKRSGKPYTTQQIEDNITWALENGIEKFDVFFMIGIPGQDEASVMETVEYAGLLMRRFGTRVMPFIAPLAPFLDPGSLAFEHSDRYGYTVLFRTFKKHLEALEKPSWKYMLNYETEHLSRDDIVRVTYEAGRRLNDLKRETGHIDVRTHETVARRIEENVLLMKEVDLLVDTDGNPKGAAAGEKLKKMMITDMSLTAGVICDNEEIKWPVFTSGFRFIRIAHAVIGDIIRRMVRE